MTIRAGLIAIPALFFGWLLVLVVVGLFADEAPAFVVVLPRMRLCLRGLFTKVGLGWCCPPVFRDVCHFLKPADQGVPNVTSTV